MPRDLSGCGRYPPVPRYTPYVFYTAVRVGDPELLAKVMEADPYFVTQDNGAGAPLHFAVTYRQLDMAHHLLNNGALVNQRDARGLTPLHRAAHLAHLDGYLELYEYLLSRGADPAILSDDYDPYLNPGKKLPVEVAVENEGVRAKLLALEARYAPVPKAPEPHPDAGDWWALYDYGLEAVTAWAHDYQHPYPELLKREREAAARRERRQARRAARDAALAALAAGEPHSRFLELAAAAESHGDAAAIAASVMAARGTATGLAPLGHKGLSAGTGQQQAGGGAASAFLFPGQGSQALGMLVEAARLPRVKEMLAAAQQVLGYDLLELCINGPQERLDDTTYSQPALFVAGLAAVELLRSRDAGAVAAAGAAAGLSLGEYCALVFGGAMTFEDGLRVVKVRAEAMAAAARAGVRPHGMLSIVGVGDADLVCMCEEAATQLGGDTVCHVANHLFPQGRVVSGHLDALDLVQASALESGALRAQRLAVSGAFHTRLMAPASEALAAALATVEVRPPSIPVYSNVTAQPVPRDPEAIRQLLARQLVEPVQWEATLRALLAAGHAPLSELGPGQQIKSMVRRISPEAWRVFVNVAP